MISIFAFGAHLATCVFQQTTCIHDFVNGSPVTTTINYYEPKIEGEFMGPCDAPASSQAHNDINNCLEIYCSTSGFGGQITFSTGGSGGECNDGFFGTVWDTYSDTTSHTISHSAEQVPSDKILKRGYKQNITASAILYPITITLFGATFNGFWGRMKHHVDSCIKYRILDPNTGSGGSGN